MLSIRQIIVIAAISLALFVLGGLPAVERQAAFPSGQNNGLAERGQAFKDVKLSAKAAYVYDIEADKPIFEYNADAQLPLASLTKLMTAIVIRELAPEGLLVRITKEAVGQEGDSGFAVGEKIKLQDLLAIMLVSSSNDAAYAAAQSYADAVGGFVSLMNKKARQLGLGQTFFINPTGLDFSEKVAGAYGSAKDAARLLMYAYEHYPDLFGETARQSLSYKGKVYRNTDKLVGRISRILAGKTGFSQLAGGNLAVIADIGFNHPVAIVVLGSTEEGRFQDVETLYKETIKYWRNKTND